MHIKTIAVNYERKVNLGNYESATISASAWADLDKDEDPDICFQGLWLQIRGEVRDIARKITASRRNISDKPTDQPQGMVKSDNEDPDDDQSIAATWNETSG